MIIDIGNEYVVSTENFEDGPVCHITFPITEEDFKDFNKFWFKATKFGIAELRREH